jgi:hypothetical protein
MTTPSRNRLITIFILLFPFILFTGFLVSEINGPLPPLLPLPNPNGYDDLVKAGQMVSSNSWNFEQLDTEPLRETVSANAGALALARTGLSRECRVPLQFSMAYATNHIHDLIALRSLAQAFAAEGRLAELEGRLDEAARSGLDTIRLGIEAVRGGTMIDGMIGTAIESFGLKPLQNISGRLDARTCRETAASLETLGAQSPSWADLVQQDNAWSRRTFPGIGYQLEKLAMISSIRKARQKAGQTFGEHEKETRQLILELAARAYELEKGHRPANPADLVPDYLKAVPEDPFTGTNLVYSPR